MGLDLNLPDDYAMSETDFDKIVAGNMLPVGTYGFQVTEVRETAAKSSDSEGIEFELTVIDGPLRGQSIKDVLWDTPGVRDKRWPIFQARLGATIKQGDKYVKNPNFKSWRDAIGAKVNGEVIHEDIKDKNTDAPTGKKRAKLAFNGLYPYDPSKHSGGGVAGGVAPSGSSAPSSTGAPLPAGAGASRYDTSDL